MSSANASRLNPEILESRPVRVIQKAIHNERLSHALLIHGESLESLELLARHITGLLLETQGDVLKHPDFFSLEPSGKARQIRVGTEITEPNTVRALMHGIQLSPVVAKRKVALIREVDRFNTASANALLKTLEEPPSDTTLILITTRPYDLLPTIRSRCLNFRIPTGSQELTDPEWQKWLRDYRNWIKQLFTDKHFAKNSTGHAVIPVFSFILRFNLILERLDSELWKISKEQLPETIDEDQLDAIKVGHSKILRLKMLAHLEYTTSEQAKEWIAQGNLGAIYAVCEVTRILEKCVGLLELNMNIDAALEYFFLNSLKLWARSANTAS